MIKVAIGMRRSGKSYLLYQTINTKNIQLYLTGSSAKLLSKEINTSLRGRSLALEVLPYRFQEYLDTHQITANKKPFGQESFDQLKHHLLQYFNVGGFPGIQKMEENEWRETLQGYVDTVILKDIIERHNVNNIALLKYLTLTLIRNSSAIFSVHKFHKDIRNQGYSVGKETIYNYLNYIQDAFLIFTVQHYAESERLRQTKAKKIYAIDTGLVNATTLNMNNNIGKLLENLLYLDLRRAGKKIYYYITSEGYEVDFVTIDETGSLELIQATWDLSDPRTAERETRALEQAQKELGIPGKMVTARDYLRDWI